ncbi:WGxxGxxG family protein [Paenibacillus sp. Soil750]|uniref:WGxxGxxG family protein n=1 Tax=Paenibacillus sp. Soil750 TaxID=1736398 RepID=UPI0012F7BF7C|nr:WGxxGxxG family protein [Paenibacillus sp. Soil750]
MKKVQTLTFAILLTSALSFGTVGAHENAGVGMNSSTSINTNNNVNNYSPYGTNTGTISSPPAFPSTKLNQTNYGTGLNSYSTNNSIRAYDTANSGSNASNWGWLGLLGLIGLAGMRSRNNVGER